MPDLNGQQVGPIGYGMMGLTWRPVPPSDEQAFAALRKALEVGANFWNGGEIYGPPGRNSLNLLERYFAKYPEDADRVVLSVKGIVGEPCAGAANGPPDNSPAEVRRSIEACLKDLGGRKKKIDIFEPARRDPKTPLAVTLRVMEEYVNKGLIGGIALSEVSAATIHEAVKITKIVAVEVELSMWSTDVLTNGVAAACAQYDIPLVAYAPLGRGVSHLPYLPRSIEKHIADPRKMLTGQFKSPEDIPEGDVRKGHPRFQPENFEINLQLVRQVQELAAKKGCTPAQLAIAWTRALSARSDMPVIIPIPGATTAERVEENTRLLQLTDHELEEINGTLANFQVRGTRYPAGVPVEG
ncbi:NADP-dependent oxidoreductase domain-containing protein [Coniochaeta sp. 2T2.1]|nr:NADP-dependent oxidoreductase domain-containing protein [Coniochaeta sp. 2T2.1]